MIYPKEYEPTVTKQDVSYGPTSLPKPGGGTASQFVCSYYGFTPTGDDAVLSVAFAKSKDVGAPVAPTPTPPSPPAQSPPATPVPGQADSRTIPVDFFGAPTISFSVGVLWSTLQDENFLLVPNPKDSMFKTSVITAGNNPTGSPKGLALIHFSVLKSGDNLIGPSLGITSDAGYLAGFSYLYGKSSRVALTIGTQFASVKRLAGPFYVNQVVPNGTTVTQPSFQSRGWQIAITYAFGTQGNK